MVAIDLGTSRSAWAFAIKGRAENDIIICVPQGSRSSISAMKTGNTVLLSEHDDVLAFGRAARERFIEDTGDNDGDVDGEGWLEVDGDEEEKTPHSASGATGMLFRWFKVALCQQRGYQSVDDPIATADGGQTRPLLRVMTAVLSHFKEDTLASLSSVSEVAHGVEDVTWVLTIPAIYDDFVKRFMRIAAHEAGIISTVDSSRLQLYLEPEAVCLAVNVKEAPMLCGAGTKAMILDCGGGTVDIITHEVLSMQLLRLKEILRQPEGFGGRPAWTASLKSGVGYSWVRIIMTECATHLHFMRS